MCVANEVKKRAGGRWHEVQARAAEIYNTQFSGLWCYENCLERALKQVCKGSK